MPKYICDCGKSVKSESALTQHQQKCSVILQQSRDSFRAARRAAALEEQQREERRSQKRLRHDSSVQNPPLARDYVARPSQLPDLMDVGHPDNSDSTPLAQAETRIEHAAAPERPAVTTRVGRQVRATWKVRDQVPEGEGVVFDDSEPQRQPPEESAGSSGGEPPTRRLTLLVTERIRTVANRFGLSRLYKRRPIREPDPSIGLETVYTPTQSQRVAPPPKRTIHEIIAPHPNFTTFLFNHQFWLAGHKKTRNERAALRDVIVREDFKNEDLTGVNFDQLDKKLGSSTLDSEAPWVRESDGWKKESISIGIPPLKKPNQAERRQAVAEHQRVLRGDGLPIPAATRSDSAFEGVPLTVLDFWHKDLCAEIKHTFSSDEAARSFVYDPYLMYHARPDTGNVPEPVYSELFNSQTVVDEDIRIQHLPREADDDLPRAMAMLMWHSDVTHVTQFGDSKVWPGYLYFGNQTKYETSRPSCHGAHHVAFFPSLPKDVQDQIQQKLGKGASAPVLTHLRRELFHAAWHALMNPEFVQAYREGIVVDCKDGVRRRIYPRIFTYSADYPEKMLIATLRDKGQHPCPHCLITFEDIPKMGTSDDRKLREDLARVDNKLRQDLVKQARRLMYQEGYAINGDKVNDILKGISGVPTVNAFSELLSDLGLDVFRILVPDVLHEFELGIWKAVFSHLVRILHSISESLVRELDRRYRQVATFGKTTIRRFSSDASEMHQIGARDYEDLLQCAIPCFEGLLPSPDNEHVLSLLYVMAYWHGLAKMRMHTESSVQLLDATYTVMGSHLRHFEQVVCPRYITKETQKEYAKRIRAASRKKSASAAPLTPAASGQKPRSFNLSTIKAHLLGYAPRYIRMYGPLDMLSTMKGEHEHRRVKARRARTNGRQAEGQMAEIEIREGRLRYMADELRACGVKVPDFSGKGRDTSIPAGPLAHHWIAQESDGRIAIDLAYWQRIHPNDPAVERFTHRLRAHMLKRVTNESDSIPANDKMILIKDNRIYRHATLQINYTTYDVRRDVDTMHPSRDDRGFSLDKTGILVHNPTSSTKYPWSYAIILGVFHAHVYQSDASEAPIRIDFLWVRWLDHDWSWQAGPRVRRLERLTLASLSDHDGTGFIDPATIIRGCHLIPAFHHGILPASGAPSIADDRDGNKYFYYVARFVDRDMMARHIGMSVGSGGLQAHESEVIADDPALLQETDAAIAARATSLTNPGINFGVADTGSNEPDGGQESADEDTDGESISSEDSNSGGLRSSGSDSEE